MQSNGNSVEGSPGRKRPGTPCSSAVPVGESSSGSPSKDVPSREEFSFEYLRNHYEYRMILSIYGHLVNSVAKMENEDQPINWVAVKEEMQNKFPFPENNHLRKLFTTKDGEDLKELYNRIALEYRELTERIKIHRDYTKTSEARRLGLLMTVKFKEFVELENTKGHRTEFESARRLFSLADRKKYDLDALEKYVLETLNPCLEDFLRGKRQQEFPDVARIFIPPLRSAYDRYRYKFPYGDRASTVEDSESSRVPADTGATSNMSFENDAQDKTDESAMDLAEDDEVHIVGTVTPRVVITEQQVELEPGIVVLKLNGDLPLAEAEAATGLKEAEEVVSMDVDQPANEDVVPIGRFEEAPKSTEKPGSRRSRDSSLEAPSLKSVAVTAPIGVSEAVPRNGPSSVSPRLFKPPPVPEVSQAVKPTVTSPAIRLPLKNPLKRGNEGDSDVSLPSAKILKAVTRTGAAGKSVVAGSPTASGTRPGHSVIAKDSAVAPQASKDNTHKEGRLVVTDPIDMVPLPVVDNRAVIKRRNAELFLKMKVSETGSETNVALLRKMLTAFTGFMFNNSPSDIVDYDLFKLPVKDAEYGLIVRHPQCVLELAEKLSGDAPPSQLDFTLIADNALAYNSEGDIWNQSFQLHGFIQQHVRDIAWAQHNITSSGSCSSCIDSLKETIQVSQPHARHGFEKLNPTVPSEENRIALTDQPPKRLTRKSNGPGMGFATPGKTATKAGGGSALRATKSGRKK